MRKKALKITAIFIIVNILVLGTFVLLNVNIATLDLSSRAGVSNIQIFYNNNKQDVYDTQHSVEGIYDNNGRFKKVRFVLLPKTLNKLRIDFGDRNNAQYEIEYLSIMVNPFYKYVISGKDFLKSFVPNGNISGYGLSGDNILITTSGTDPYIYALGKLHGKKEINAMMILFEIVFLLVLVIAFNYLSISKGCERVINKVESKFGFKELKAEVSCFVKFCKSNYLLVFVSLFFVILCYGIKLFYYSISIDTEFAIHATSQDGWIRDGRFGIAITKLIFGTVNFVPYVEILFGIVAVFIASLVWSYLLYTGMETNQKRSYSIIVFAALFISYPSNSEYMNFLTYNFEVSFGLIMCAIAVLLVSKWIISNKPKAYLLVGLIFMVLSFATYQAFLSVYIAGVCIYAILYYTNKNKGNDIYNGALLHMIIKYAITFIVGLVLYFLVDRIFKIFVPQGDYLNNFMGWKTQSFKTVIINIIKYIYDLLFGASIFGGKMFTFAFFIGIILVVRNWLSTEKYKLFFTLAVGILLISPFLTTIILGSAIPIRAQLAIPLVTAFVCYYIVQLVNFAMVRNIICICLVLVAFYQGENVAKLYYGEYNKYQQDVILANKISERIEALNLGDIPKEPVVFVGKHILLDNITVIRREVLGYSFFEWDNGNPGRIISFMNTLGYNYRFPNDEQTVKGKQYAEKMPEWPSAGSVKSVAGVIIVKLSKQ